MRKSLIAPNIADAIARGRETFGMQTKAVPVLYAAIEDEAGMRLRVGALPANYGVVDGFKLVSGVSDLIHRSHPTSRRCVRS